MKLNINKNEKGDKLSAVLGIPPARVSELMVILRDMTEIIKSKNDICDMAEFYVKLADECANLEEYTFCVHLLSAWVIENCKIY